MSPLGLSNATSYMFAFPGCAAPESGTSAVSFFCGSLRKVAFEMPGPCLNAPSDSQTTTMSATRLFLRSGRESSILLPRQLELEWPAAQVRLDGDDPAVARPHADLHVAREFQPLAAHVRVGIVGHLARELGIVEDLGERVHDALVATEAHDHLVDFCVLL